MARQFGEDGGAGTGALPGTEDGFRTARGEGSLGASFGSVATRVDGTFWRRFLAFLGPGYLVAVGYMDPGNWATSLAGGSEFGYTLLFAVLLSSVMAIVLQALCARFAVATGRDLAQACRDSYSRPVSFGLWILAELAIVATDLAEVIGTAIALKLLFGLPLEYGVVVTALDVFVILWLQSRGFRRVEAFVATMILVIAVCFVAQMILAQPAVAAVMSGFLPSSSIVTDERQLYLALGILGATVMPHNLYLHTGIVHTRAFGRSAPEKREAATFATMDSTIALGLALLVNASILILAASAFHASGHGTVGDLEEAHSLLAPLLGSALAPILFAVALLASGLSSTVTATLAGQIVMEGFLRLKLSLVVRRLVTRGLAILPAAGIIILYGESSANDLLVFSQVVLSLQLPFAVVPLVMMSGDAARMGALKAPRWLMGIAVAIATLIVVLNVKLVVDFVSSGL